MVGQDRKVKDTLHKHILITNLACPGISNYKVKTHNSLSRTMLVCLLLLSAQNTQTHTHLQTQVHGSTWKKLHVFFVFFPLSWPLHPKFWRLIPLRVELKETDALIVPLWTSTKTFPLFGFFHRPPCVLQLDRLIWTGKCFQTSRQGVVRPIYPIILPEHSKFTQGSRYRHCDTLTY